MILKTANQSAKTRHVEGIQFECCKCHQIKPVQTKGGTGYATQNGKRGRLICYQCMADIDRKDMIKTGRAILYLSLAPFGRRQNAVEWSKQTVSNWPGTLKFKVSYGRISSHNIARTRYDVWFTGPDGANWHGVQIGDNTQICRCKRVKS